MIWITLQMKHDLPRKRLQQIAAIGNLTCVTAEQRSLASVISVTQAELWWHRLDD